MNEARLEADAYLRKRSGVGYLPVLGTYAWADLDELDRAAGVHRAASAWLRANPVLLDPDPVGRDEYAQRLYHRSIRIVSNARNRYSRPS